MMIVRRRTRHHVAFDVPASAEWRQQAGVDLGNRLLQMTLEDAVQLDALPSRQAERAVRMDTGDIVDGEVLPGRERAARYPAPDHEHVLLARGLLRAGLPRIPIFLLI